MSSLAGDYSEHCARDLVRFVPLDVDWKLEEGCRGCWAAGHGGEVADGLANWQHGIGLLGFPGAI